MTRQDLIDRIAAAAEISKAKAAVALDCVLEAIPEAVARGEDVRLIGFGTFSARTREASAGRNPRTGERIEIAEQRVPKFSAGTEFKRRVNEHRAGPPTPRSEVAW